MKYHHLFLSIAFGVSGLYDIITKGIDHIWGGGWFFIFISCGFVVLFIRDNVKNIRIHNSFVIVSKVFFGVAVLILLGSVIYRLFLR